MTSIGKEHKKSKKSKKKSKKDPQDSQPKKADLFGDQEDSGDDDGRVEGLRVNRKYATAYESRKRHEELRALSAKERELLEEESSDTTEDDEGELLTAQIATDFLRVLPLIASKDEQMYDKEKRFFTDAGDARPKKEKSSNKDRMRPKDVLREQVLDAIRDGEEVLRDSDEEEDSKQQQRHQQLDSDMTYVEQQKALKRAFQTAAEIEREVDDDDEEDDFLTKRPQTEDEQHKFDRDYNDFLKEKKLEALSKEDVLKRYWNDDNLDEDERFLRDYIVNNGWLDDAEYAPQHSTVHTLDFDEKDEEELEAQDKFEATYNFRHEQPGSVEVKSFPRNVQSVRRDSNRRKEQRERRKERKEAQKAAKRQELQRLKKLRRKEVKQQLEKIQSITGTESIPTALLESDFDPNAFDEQMSTAFDDKYYEDEPEYEEEEFDEEIRKPVFEHDPLVDDIVVESEPQAQQQQQQQRKEQQQKMKSAVDSYVEDMYKLHFEDVIGDMPTRFKYVQVQPNSFGLTGEQVLTADERLLNAYVPLRCVAPYRQREYWTTPAARAKLLRALTRDSRAAQHEQEEEEERRRRDLRRQRKADKRAKRKQKQKGGDDASQVIQRDDAKTTTKDEKDDEGVSSAERARAHARMKKKAKRERRRARKALEEKKRDRDDDVEEQQQQQSEEKKRKKKKRKKDP